MTTTTTTTTTNSAHGRATSPAAALEPAPALFRPEAALHHAGGASDEGDVGVVRRGFDGVSRVSGGGRHSQQRTAFAPLLSTEAAPQRPTSHGRLSR